MKPKKQKKKAAMSNYKNNKIQHSIIAGGLTSSAGIFISKAIGILYVTPFTALATSENIAYYSYGYTLYDLALQLAVAGIPVAVAALIAKYYVKKDIATIFLIRKIARNLLFFIGLLSMTFIIVFASPLATFIITDNMSAESITRTTNVLRIIGVAMLVTPILGSYRSIFQGLKYMDIYATSQVIEQFVRVGFMLGVGYILVVLIGMDPIWAVYVAIGAAVVAGIASILHLRAKEKKLLVFLESEATTTTSDIEVSTLIKEIIAFSIPFMIISFLGNSFSLVNLMFFNRFMFFINESASTINLLFSMIMFTTSKLTTIPQVLALGFSVAVIPYISEAMYLKDSTAIKKNIYDTIETVLYFAIPLSAGLFFFATPIYYLFYGYNAILGGQVLQYASFGGVFLALSPVVTMIMLTVRLRKQVIVVLTLGFVVKVATMFPLMWLIGYPGAIISTYLSSTFIVGANLFLLAKQYNLKYMSISRKFLLMGVGVLGIGLTYYISTWIGINYLEVSRMLTLVYLAIFGGFSMVVYAAITWFFQLPQTIFNIKSFKDILKRR
jgi:O-antigen/teichoic acid export membrane protein